MFLLLLFYILLNHVTLDFVRVLNRSYPNPAIHWVKLSTILMLRRSMQSDEKLIQLEYESTKSV